MRGASTADAGGNGGGIGAARSLPAPAAGVDGARAYQPPRFAHPIDLDLSANEGPAPADWLRGAVGGLDLERARRYPHARHDLEAALAERHGVPASRVLVTAGGDEAIDRCCRAVLAPGRRIALTRPTFEMIPRYAVLAGATCVEVDWMDGPFPTDAFVDAARGAAMAAIVSPNNPTGLSITTDEFVRSARAMAGTLVLADLAYAEFADEDPTPELVGVENVVVVRTFSKAWGLAGLRVGYAIAHEPAISWLRAAAGPYSVSGVSVAIARVALETGEAWMRGRVAMVQDERARIAAMARSLGLGVLESQANFVLVRCGAAGRAGAITESLARQGIAVRHFAARPGLEDAVRISCPASERDVQRLLGAMERVMGDGGAR